MTADDLTAIDVETIRQLKGLAGTGGSDLLGELLTLFESNTHETIAALRLATEQCRDAEAVRVAHTLAGAAMTVGASGIAVAAKRMEALAKDGRGAELEPHMAAIAEALPSVMARMREMDSPGTTGR